MGCQIEAEKLDVITFLTRKYRFTDFVLEKFFEIKRTDSIISV